MTVTYFKSPSFYIPNTRVTVLWGMPDVSPCQQYLSGAHEWEDSMLLTQGLPPPPPRQHLSITQANMDFSAKADLGRATPAQRRPSSGRVGGPAMYQPRNLLAKLLGTSYLSLSARPCLLPANHISVYFQLKMVFVLFLFSLYLETSKPVARGTRTNVETLQTVLDTDTAPGRSPSLTRACSVRMKSGTLSF